MPYPSNATDAPRYLRPRNAAKRYDISKSLLDNWRVTGDGPPYIKLGNAVLYDVAATDAWFDARHVSSTSEADRRAGK